MVIIGSSGSPIQGMMNALRLRKYSAIIQVGEKIIVIVSLIALLNLWKRNVDSIIISVVMGTGIGLLFRYIKYISQYNEVSASIENRMSDKYIFNEIRNRMARYCYPFVLWGGITWLQLFGERWIISFLLDSTQVGKYGFASTLLNSTVVLAATILAQFATPIVYKLYSSQNENSRKRGLKVIKILCWSTIILFSTFALIFFLYGAEIIALFSLSTFSIPTITLVTLCLGIGLFYVTQALTCIGLALHRPNIYLIPKLTTAGLSVIGYYFGCKYFGITGVAGVIVIVNSIYYFLVNRSNKILTRSSSGC
jgi:O-antigen/teichoic acid export membrane protein